MKRYRSQIGVSEGAEEELFDAMPDISEEEKNENVLQNKAVLLQTLLHSIPDMVYFKDRQGRFLFVNKACERTMNLPQEDIAGRSSYEFLPEEIRELAKVSDREVYDEGKEIRVEHILKLSDGPRTIDTLKAPLRDEEGNIIGLVGISRDITERKRAEEELRKSEEKYRYLFDVTPVVIGTTTEAGQVLVANAAHEKLSGYTLEELRSINIRDRYVQPGVRDEVLKILRETGRIRDYEVEFKRKDGSVYCVLLNMDRIELEGREVFLVTQRDITERKRLEKEIRMHRDHLEELVKKRTADLDSANRILTHEIEQRKLAEEALRESEDRFRRLLNNAPIAISMVNRDGTIEYVNGKHPQLMGYDLKDIPTLDRWWSLAYPDEADRTRIAAAWNEIVNRVFSGEKLVNLERRIVCKDGTSKDFELSISAAADKIIVAFGDITERKKTEDALRKSKDLLDESERLGHVGSWEMDIGTQKIVGSDEFFRLFCLRSEKFQQTVEEVINMICPDERPMLPRHYRETLKTRVFRDIEYRVMKPDGSIRHILARGKVHTNAAGEPVRLAGTVQDITEQRRLERELLAMEDSERIRIGQDVHDGLGQILAAASFRCSVFERSLSEHPEMAVDARELSGLINTAKEQTRLIARGLVPIEPGGESLPVALRQLIEGCNLLFDVCCEFVSSGNILIKDHSAALNLYRIAQEALTNAVRHGRPHRIVLSLTKIRNGITLKISDDGCGFETSSGQGMGLRIMNYRARLINAKISVRSRLGAGTEVTCTYIRMHR